ncbi:MAG: hypothetical protein F6K28_05595 [Microcoleus sp. SIO2G3]|nr:hypothetical protein [Microcoleus sp. SIO2G3]
MCQYRSGHLARAGEPSEVWSGGAEPLQLSDNKQVSSPFGYAFSTPSVNASRTGGGNPRTALDSPSPTLAYK